MYPGMIKLSSLIRCLGCIFILTSLSIQLHAQLDSLIKLLTNLHGPERIPVLEQLMELSSDDEKIPYLLELSKFLRYSDPKRAFNHALEARHLALKNENSTSLAIAYSRMANIYFTPWLNYDSALWSIKESIEILEKQPPDEELGRAYNLGGIINADQGELEEGIRFFEKAERVFQQIHDSCWATTIHHNIGKIYKYSEQFELAKKYFLECLDQFQRNNCPEEYDYLFVNLGGMYEESGDFGNALKYLNAGLKISQKMEHREEVGASLLMIGKIHRKQGDYTTARKLFNDALSISEEYNINKLKIAVNQELAVLLMEQGKYREAKIFLDSSLYLATQINKLSQLSTSYELLHKYYLNTGAPQQALENYKLHIKLRDSLDSEKAEIKIANLESEKQEQQIAILNRENEIFNLKLNRSRLFIYLLVSVILLSLLVFYLLFRNYLHRQKVKNIEIKNESSRKILNMERRIMASVIETENRERKRFALELHDGLGPLLSSVKLYLGEIIGSSEDDQEDMVKQADEIIDSAIKNTREISNNILPSTLTQKGLKDSIEAFIVRIERVSGLKVEIKDFVIPSGEGKRLNPGLEVVLFRVLTELINNTVKHANASKVNLSIREENEQIHIVYSDDGKGFSVEKTLRSSSGMGLNNIKDRIHELHGTIQILSQPNNGTEFRIIIPV